ncbi:RNA polymerase sigma factor [Nocardioides marmoriginsengisoli]|uniref:RNA polymerase sigma factor n=1 Tax=Nocardioides marmoriginsengisoli TaxID=661483 RepID=A0A3N0CBJ5_9ACTN|nr:RNA polymerase sigma factor [Nocardioides marmoriginsengisoli]RNL60827.1 RNA polymerase sigma factor [Nocardioides marmoriginsengisoli]
MTRSDSDAEDRFRTFYTAHFEALLAYAVRRVEQPADAADVVADSFLVAWRRRATLPAGDEGRLWLYGVARKALANHHRGGRRRDRLGQRLRERLAETTFPDPGHELAERDAVRDALSRLPDLDREVLTLTVWEGLEPREIAEVLRLPAATVRQRLSRARTRLRALAGDDPGPPGHVALETPRASVRPVLVPEENR